MGMFSWTEKSPAVLQGGGVVGPDERLPWGQTGLMGVQHVVAMFGSTVLAPLLMGFDPNLAVLMSGIGTLVFFLVTGGKVPSYLGSSFAESPRLSRRLQTLRGWSHEQQIDEVRTRGA